MRGPNWPQFSSERAPHITNTKAPRLSSGASCQQMHSRPLAIASEPSARNPAPSTSMCWITRIPMQQRASESIGALAAALAKAQIELINPEKSLVATIHEEGRYGREQT